MARKFKLTDTVLKNICDAISIGATNEIACAYAGISPATFYIWRGRGEKALALLEKDPQTELTKEEKLFLRFYDKTEAARAYAAIGWLDVIANAARSDPSWARFMLKVRYPDGYSERVDLNTGGEVIVKIDTQFKKALERVYGNPGIDDESQEIPAGGEADRLSE